MCIIAIKSKKQELQKKEILKTCWQHNPDGAGYMFTNNNKVVIKKGFMTFDEFYNSLLNDYNKYNLINNNLVLHFRIGTSGGINKEKTHPFPLTNNIDELNKTELTSKIGIAHNGVISSYVYGTLSDTQNFIKDYLYSLNRLNKNFYKYNDIQKMIDKELKGRLAILDSDDNLVTIGDWVTDENYKYSNTTFRDYKYYSNTWDDYNELNNYTYNNWDNEKVWYDKKDFTLLKVGDKVQLSNGYTYTINDNNLYVIDEFMDFYEILNETKYYYKLDLIDTDCVLWSDDYLY